MMHSRAMGRGKRQATARCPNSHVQANDIYQVTPAYRLGSSVSVHSGGERGDRGTRRQPKVGVSPLMDLFPFPSRKWR